LPVLNIAAGKPPLSVGFAASIGVGLDHLQPLDQFL
jgi:hypothetical protein